MLRHELTGDFKEFENDEDKAFACGGFPIQINGKGIAGVVSISGLTDPQDHIEVVKALADLCGRKIPQLIM